MNVFLRSLPTPVWSPSVSLQLGACKPYCSDTICVNQAVNYPMDDYLPEIFSYPLAFIAFKFYAKYLLVLINTTYNKNYKKTFIFSTLDFAWRRGHYVGIICLTHHTRWNM